MPEFTSFTDSTTSAFVCVTSVMMTQPKHASAPTVKITTTGRIMNPQPTADAIKRFADKQTKDSFKLMENAETQPSQLKRLGINGSTWAEEFVSIHGGDVKLLVTWFANAIEAGYDRGYKAGYYTGKQHGRKF